MNQIKEAYDNLVVKYKSLMKSVDDKVTRKRLAVADVFSIEPFYHELNEVSIYDFEFYGEASQIPAGHEKLICYFEEDKILQIRNEYREETYYDIFFVYKENEKWRLQLFVNRDDIKSTKVERLILDNEGRAVSYETYDEKGYVRFSYTYKGESVEQKHYDEEGGLLETRELVFKEKTNFDIESMFEQVKTIIVNAVMKSLEVEGVYLEEDNEEPVECILLQYTPQNPFPPLVAMSPEEPLEKGEYPFYYYSANDMKHELFLDFSVQSISAMETLNTYFEKQMHDIECDVFDEGHIDEVLKIEAEIFDIYVGVCKKIKAQKNLKSLIPVTKTFHVTARDFERCNEWAFLQAIVSKSRLKKIQKQLDDYNDGAGLSIDQLALMEEFNFVLNEENKAYSSLKNRVDNMTLDIKYSQSLLYFLEPYDYELHYNKACIPGPLVKNTRLSVDCVSKKYYKYHFKDESVCFISHYDGERLLNEIFVTYDNEKASVHNYHYATSGLYLVEYEYLEYKNSQPYKLMNYKASFLTETCFEVDVNNRLLSSNIVTTFIQHPTVKATTSKKYYQYDDSGAMIKITCETDMESERMVLYPG